MLSPAGVNLCNESIWTNQRAESPAPRNQVTPDTLEISPNGTKTQRTNSLVVSSCLWVNGKKLASKRAIFHARQLLPVSRCSLHLKSGVVPFEGGAFAEEEVVEGVVGFHHFGEHVFPWAVGDADEAGVVAFAVVLAEPASGGGLIDEGEPLDADDEAECGALLHIVSVGEAALLLAADFASTDEATVLG